MWMETPIKEGNLPSPISRGPQTLNWKSVDLDDSASCILLEISCRVEPFLCQHTMCVGADSWASWQGRDSIFSSLQSKSDLTLTEIQLSVKIM